MSFKSVTQSSRSHPLLSPQFLNHVFRGAAPRQNGLGFGAENMRTLSSYAGRKLVTRGSWVDWEVTAAATKLPQRSQQQMAIIDEALVLGFGLKDGKQRGASERCRHGIGGGEQVPELTLCTQQRVGMPHAPSITTNG
jgi:hypothetical protein